MLKRDQKQTDIDLLARLELVEQLRIAAQAGAELRAAQIGPAVHP
jgi:hypothetical protein